jgi:hypothetical protein
MEKNESATKGFKPVKEQKSPYGKGDARDKDRKSS